MDNSDIQRVRHIKSYCDDIAKTVSRCGNSYETFSQDTDFFNSISMSLMQIGELSGNLSEGL